MTLWIKICANTSLDDAQLAAQAGADAVGFVFAPSKRRVTAEQVAAIVPHLPRELEKIGVFAESAFEEIAAVVATSGLTGVQLHFDAPPELPAALRTRFGPNLRIIRTIHFSADSVSRQDFESTSKRSPDPPLKQEASGPDFSRAEDAKEDFPSPTPEEEAKGHDFSRAESSPKKVGGALAPEAVFAHPHIDAILVDSCTPTATGGTGQTYDWRLAAKTLFQNPKARERRLVAAGGLTPENVAEAIRILAPWGIDVASGVEAAPGRKDPAKLRAFIASARAARRG